MQGWNSRVVGIGLVLALCVACGQPAPPLAPKVEARASEDAMEQARFRLLAAAVGLFLVKQHIGRFPTAEEGLGLIYHPPRDPDERADWRGPYIPDEELLIDPWGNKMEMVPTDLVPDGYDIRSLGPDGVPSDDDLYALRMEPELRKSFVYDALGLQPEDPLPDGYLD